MFNCGTITVNRGEVITIVKDYTNLSSVYTPNAGFSVKWLLYNWYKYGRLSNNGVLVMPVGSTIDDAAFAVLSTISQYSQKDISFLLNDADPVEINQYIATYRIKYSGKDTINGDMFL